MKGIESVRAHSPTASRTNCGLFEPLIMYFSLMNSPATFQTMMDDIFEDLISKGVVVFYLDDILLIFTETLDEYRRITCRVLELLEKHKLYLRVDKCEFEKTTVEHLGVIISHNSVAMDPVKIAGVSEWPTPTNKKEVQSFFGFTNFYRRFIKDFSEHACPLFDLTQNDCTWRWKASEQFVFDKLKESVTSVPVLISPDLTKPFHIEADSSNFATGTVLSQVSTEDEKWHPVFFSKLLSPVEHIYEIHDKEMLATIRALQEWRHFVEGAEHPCEILMDHKKLEYFMTAKQLNRRQARWSLYLSRFDFTLSHRPGKPMGKLDALSRRADHGTGADDNSNIVLLRPKLFTVCAMEGLQLIGPEQDILRDIRKGVKHPEEEPITRAAQELPKSSARSMHSAEWSEHNGLLYYRGRIYVPDSSQLRHCIVSLCHDTKVAGHPGHFKTLPEATGGQTCHSMLVSMSLTVICVHAPKRSAVSLLVNSNHLRFQRNAGMPSVWTSSRNFQSQGATMLLWWPPTL